MTELQTLHLQVSPMVSCGIEVLHLDATLPVAAACVVARLEDGAAGKEALDDLIGQLTPMYNG